MRTSAKRLLAFLLLAILAALLWWLMRAPTPPAVNVSVEEPVHAPDHAEQPAPAAEPIAEAPIEIDNPVPATQTAATPAQEATPAESGWQVVLARIEIIVAKRSVETVHLATHGEPDAVNRAIAFWQLPDDTYDLPAIAARTAALEAEYGERFSHTSVVRIADQDESAETARAQVDEALALLPSPWRTELTRGMVDLIVRAVRTLTPPLVRRQLLPAVRVNADPADVTAALQEHDVVNLLFGACMEMQLLYGTEAWANLTSRQQSLLMHRVDHDYLIWVALLDGFLPGATDIDRYDTRLVPIYCEGLAVQARREEDVRRLPSMEALLAVCERDYPSGTIVHEPLVPTLRDAVRRLRGDDTSLDFFLEQLEAANEDYARTRNRMMYREFINNFERLGRFYGADWLARLDEAWALAQHLHPDLLQIGVQDYGRLLSSRAHGVWDGGTIVLQEAHDLLDMYATSDDPLHRLFLLGCLESVFDIIDGQSYPLGNLPARYVDVVWHDGPAMVGSGLHNGIRWISDAVQRMLSLDQARGFQELVAFQDWLAAQSDEVGAHAGCFTQGVELVSLNHSHGRLPSPREPLEDWVMATALSPLARALRPDVLGHFLTTVDRLAPCERLIPALETLATDNAQAERIQQTIARLRGDGE